MVFGCLTEHSSTVALCYVHRRSIVAPAANISNLSRTLLFEKSMLASFDSQTSAHLLLSFALKADYMTAFGHDLVLELLGKVVKSMGCC